MIVKILFLIVLHYDVQEAEFDVNFACYRISDT
jgi:hypothetical protein